jgi:hypothetical protein
MQDQGWLADLTGQIQDIDVLKSIDDLGCNLR